MIDVLDYVDEVSKFLYETPIRDRDSDPLQWWKGNENRFSHVSKLARDVLVVRATSVASESAFSTAEHMVGGKRSLLSDESITSFLLLRSWQRQLGI